MQTAGLQKLRLLQKNFKNESYYSSEKCGPRMVLADWSGYLFNFKCKGPGCESRKTWILKGQDFTVIEVKYAIEH